MKSMKRLAPGPYGLLRVTSDIVRMMRCGATERSATFGTRRVADHAWIERNTEAFSDQRTHGERIFAFERDARFEAGLTRELTQEVRASPTPDGKITNGSSRSSSMRTVERDARR